MFINVKNEDIMAQRLTIKMPKSKYIKIFTKETGPVIKFFYFLESYQKK